jgi:integrase
MAKYNKTEKRLTARQVFTLPPRTSAYADGGGLYLQVTENSTRSWIFKYSLNHKRREMGLGKLSRVGLAEARAKLSEARSLIERGIDPIAAREQAFEQEAATRAIEEAKKVTFEQAAKRCFDARSAEWENRAHARQWLDTLVAYAFPIIGSLPVASVDRDLVLKVLEPVWTKVPVTASRVRGRIETVLSWAKARGLREGDNPARWRGHLDQLLPKPNKIRKVEHHPALPYAAVPAFMQDLRAREGIIETAFEFLILTAARTAEVVGARWSEIDLDKAIWIVPAERMKKRREHRVPLPPRAIEILQEMAKLRRNEFVFFGSNSALSRDPFRYIVKRMGYVDITTHGFRSCFRDWAGEKTNFPHRLAEAALAHTVGSDTERAYQRGDMLEKRREMMTAWGAFATSNPAKIGDNVVELRAVQ